MLVGMDFQRTTTTIKSKRRSQENNLAENLTSSLSLAMEKDLLVFASELERDHDRALLDQLIAETRLYDSAKSVKELLDFTSRLRHIAPFNAMLLHIQKPGLSFAARPVDWWKRFGRRPKRHARPLVILRPFGPVDFVYDVLDTEGEPIPETAFAFPTTGYVRQNWVWEIENILRKIEITMLMLDRGDRSAGHARRLTKYKDKNRLEHLRLASTKTIRQRRNSSL